MALSKFRSFDNFTSESKVKKNNKINLEQKIKEIENEITSIEEQINILSIEYGKDFAVQLRSQWRFYNAFITIK